MSFLYSALFLPHPAAAWSQEVLHNAAQDLVKVSACVFTNNKRLRAPSRRHGDGAGDHVTFLLFVSSAVQPAGATSEGCGRRRPVLFVLVVLFLFDSHADVRRAAGPVPVLPEHGEHPARQAGGGDARRGLPVAREHPEEADGAQPARQRRRSGSEHPHIFIYIFLFIYIYHFLQSCNLTTN